ncbi:PaaX family transcriptional regulator C-terminal domain-containing protein [Parasedimentitalea psychrophila]|uniref:PaaX family transcriptional regulator C-terminal domain-containing protein n=1 Tax=Parasedimentitalea psychrophila TaxID=2997337 RepID=A0A9Y2L0H3_9RHOB|nr:PaaX family transcriptional regulator C-terminal domain-containing protein [Parasedimentitalea psychrophila]WIY26441.1 PaaX family transcriptional regulator C-terminal domain-containing protein [Parasedimentitalea psychrophila]
MTQPKDQWFETSINLLSDPQNQRVWSVIISLFGDMAQRPNEQIGGAALTRIITPMGIKPEAIRVALHRLRKDGWIDSARSGRASTHYLTQHGRDQCAAVTSRIYARDPVLPQELHVLIAAGGAGQAALDEMLLLPGYIAVNRTTALGYGPRPKTSDDLLALETDNYSLPSWFKTRLFPAELSKSCTALFKVVNSMSDPPPGLTPAQVASLRTLIVHRWRRVVLRHPDLPADFHPLTWPGVACRDRVFALLDQLPLPNLSQLREPVDA